jgi:hypothetical protein
MLDSSTQCKYHLLPGLSMNILTLLLDAVYSESDYTMDYIPSILFNEAYCD